MYLPDYVEKIIDTLEGAGFEAYAVGGCVRDYLMGIIPDDYDVTTSANPDTVKLLFEKTYDTGIEHGTVTVLMDGVPVEVTTFRCEEAYIDNRKPSSVSFVKNLEEDLKRRDFTINALAYNKRRGIVDLFGGNGDIKKGEIKCVGNPEERFEEDALRMLRAIRFACKTGFNLTDDTKTAILKKAPLIKNVSKERIKAELEKAITSKHKEKLYLFYELGISKQIAPWLDFCMKTPQNTQYHMYNVGTHMLKALEYAKPDKDVCWAALLHDVGKPYKRITDKNGVDHFKGHEEISAQIADEIMRELKFDNRSRLRIKKVIALHRFEYEHSPYGIKKAICHCGRENFDLLLSLMEADSKAHSQSTALERLKTLDLIKEIYESVKDDPITLKELKINGNDLKALGYCGGEIGIVLERLLDNVLKDKNLNQKNKLLQLAGNKNVLEI